MNFLIYINELGPNYKGDNIYEFIFSDTLEVWGESWESKPANGNPTPPNIEYITKVECLKSEEISLDLIQKSDFFCMTDSMDGVIALGWEKETSESNFDKTKRLVFRFGDTEQEIKDKLYERDIILQSEKKSYHEVE